MPRVRKIQRAIRHSSSRRFLSFILAVGLVFVVPYGLAQSSQAPGQPAATPSQPGAGLSPDSARLMQLLRTRPEMTGLLKGYLVQRMRMAGSTIDEKSITDEMLYSRIQNDPVFARDASSWLVSLAQEAAQALQAPPPAIVAQTPAPAPPESVPNAPATTMASVPAETASETASAVTGNGSRIAGSSSSSAPSSIAPPAVAPLNAYAEPAPVTLRSLPKNLLQDQEAFWTLPFHANTSDLSFVVPAAFGTALLIGSDTYIEPHLPQSPSTVSHAATASTAGMLALLRNRRRVVPPGGRQRTTSARARPACLLGKPPSTPMPSPPPSNT